MEALKLLLLFSLGCCVAALICRRLSRLSGWAMDKPDTFRKLHDAPIPRTGGLGAFAGLYLPIPLIAWWNPGFFETWWPVLLSSALMFSVGFLDDLKSLGAKIKLAGQIGVALIAFSLGLSIDRITNPFVAGQVWELGALSLPVTLFWLVALPNLINLIDGMDGLAGGVVFFMSVILAAMGFYGENMELTMLSLCLGGAVLGFLFYNFPPARIFLGDGGAYFLGFFIATSALNSSHKGAIFASLLVVIVGLGVPILDTFFAIVRRMIRGLPIFRADVDHIHHRLLQIGYSKRKALWSIYSVCAVLSAIGISILWSRGISLPIALAAIGLLAVFLVRHLGYITSWRGLKEQFHGALERRRRTQRAFKHSQMLELEIDYCTDSDEYWEMFLASLKRIGFSLEPSDPHGLFTLTHDDHALRLYYPLDPADPVDWDRLAACFEPPFGLALERFQPPRFVTHIQE